jgi:O-antigen/teichoic acid export membrane protein
MFLLIKKFKHKLDTQGGFLKSVSVLAGGTAFAQIIAVIVLPIITRLYSPEDFALFAVYASILSILAVAICLRFEIAIPLPEKDEDALSLVILALLSNVGLTLLIAVSILLFQDSILDIIKQPQLAPFIWFIPIGVFFAGLYNALQYWTTRKKQFTTIAKTRMTQSIASSSVQIGSGAFSFGAFGLILGHVINSSTGIIRLFISFRKETKELLNTISIPKLKKNWKRYDKFPKYSTFESLANVGAMQLPVIIIAAVALGPEAGYLMLAMKVMAIPMSLIGGAMAQVYLAHAPEYYNRGSLREYTVQTIKQIAKIAVIPIISIGVVAPFIFPVVFGESWVKAGYMVLWMIPWFVMQILSSPVSMSLHITGNQRIALMLQIAGLIIRVGFLSLISMFYSEWVFEYYAISGFIFYTLYLIIILMILRHNSQIYSKYS